MSDKELTVNVRLDDGQLKAIGDELKQRFEAHLAELGTENQRLSSIVRSVQQEIDFLRHVTDDPAVNSERAEGLRHWCDLIQACLDGAPPETGAGR